MLTGHTQERKKLKRRLNSIPIQCTGPPKDNDDQIAPHNCCKWSNGSSGEDDKACMYHNT